MSSCLLTPGHPEYCYQSDDTNLTLSLSLPPTAPLWSFKTFKTRVRVISAASALTSLPFPVLPHPSFYLCFLNISLSLRHMCCFSGVLVAPSSFGYLLVVLPSSPSLWARVRCTFSVLHSLTSSLHLTVYLQLFQYSTRLQTPPGLELSLSSAPAAPVPRSGPGLEEIPVNLCCMDE